MSNMELWIRSQDRKILQKVNKLYVATFSEEQGFGIYDLRYDDLEDIDDTDVPLGFYKSKERALEVLDEIENILKPPMKIITHSIEPKDFLNYSSDVKILPSLNELKIQQADTWVYQMPKE